MTTKVSPEPVVEAFGEMPHVEIVGHSGYRPERVEGDEWYVNIDFSRDLEGWIALDQILQAIDTPPPGGRDIRECCELSLWSDAGIRITLNGTCDPAHFADNLRLVILCWEDGW